MAEFENKNVTEETVSKQTAVSAEEVLKEETTTEKVVSEEVVLEETTAEDASNEGTDEESKKKGFFGKKEKKDKKDEQIADLTDKLKRNMAEFDNYRKRTDKEKTAMYEVGAKAVVEKILPTIDNFERALKAAPEEKTPFVDGMEMVYKQLLKSLAEIGVEPIEAVGKEFDPNLHNAVMNIENDEVGENIVVQEFQKGYTYKGAVVRYSMVQVANAN